MWSGMSFVVLVMLSLAVRMVVKMRKDQEAGGES
jgi:hypothetical protein